MRNLLLTGLLIVGGGVAGWPADGLAQGYLVRPVEVVDWRPVAAQVAAADERPVPARIAGTLTELTARPGDLVRAGQPLGRLVDPKIADQGAAIDAEVAALRAQLANAEADLARAEALARRGAQSAQARDQTRTSADVLRRQIAAEEARRRVLTEQQAEGAVLAPFDGRVLWVPAARGDWLAAGETVAVIAGRPTLRLSAPERFAPALTPGTMIDVETPEGPAAARVATLYPRIEGGEVRADLDLPGLDARFIGARMEARLPLLRRSALLVPEAALSTRDGLDFVALSGGGERLVVPGPRRMVDGVAMVELLSGVAAGETVAAP